jgi:hypothetical protein
MAQLMKHLSSISSFKKLLVTDRLATFVVRVGLFIFAVVAIDYALTLLTPPGDSVFAYVTTEKQPQVARRLDAGINDVDVVFFGSSRAQFAFVPEVFEGMAGIRSYNAGIGGFLETNLHYDMLRRILKGGNPKMIIYAVDDIALNAEPLRDKTGQILQAFSSIRLLRRGLYNAVQAMADDGWQIPAFKEVRLNLRPFNSYDGYTVHADGWVEGKGTANPSVIRHKGMSFSPDPDAVVFLHRLIRLALDRSIPIVLVQTPTHSEYLKSAEARVRRFTAFMNGVAAEYGIRFLDFAEPGRFPLLDAGLFFDTSHLNAQGARLFSRLLAKEILPPDADTQ